MEILINGRFTEQCQEKTVELNGSPVKCLVAVIETGEDRLPVTAWGDKKVGYVKEAIASGQPVKIVAHLQAKPQTYTNHEGETVTVPNMQLKLFAFVGVPKANNYSAPDPTGSFVSATPERKAEYLAPLSYSYKPAKESLWREPWRGNMEGAL